MAITSPNTASFSRKACIKQGVIAGTYYHYGFPHGFIYMNGVFKDVKVPNSPSSTLDGINGYGYVTGTAYGSGGVQVVYIAHCQ